MEWESEDFIHILIIVSIEKKNTPADIRKMEMISNEIEIESK